LLYKKNSVGGRITPNFGEFPPLNATSFFE